MQLLDVVSETPPAPGEATSPAPRLPNGKQLDEARPLSRGIEGGASFSYVSYVRRCLFRRPSCFFDRWRRSMARGHPTVRSRTARGSRRASLRPKVDAGGGGGGRSFLRTEAASGRKSEGIRRDRRRSERKEERGGVQRRNR